jgi:hypothetical protein
MVDQVRAFVYKNNTHGGPYLARHSAGGVQCKDYRQVAAVLGAIIREQRQA